MPIIRTFTVDGRTQTVRQWARELDITVVGLNVRLRKGIDPAEACTRPKHYFNYQKRFTYKGQTQNVKDWAKTLGLCANTLYARLNKGMSFEDAVTTVYDPARYIEYDGRRQTIRQWAQEIGVKKATLHERLKHNSIEKALTMKFHKRKPKRSKSESHSERVEPIGGPPQPLAE